MRQRLLVLNPNTTGMITQRMVSHGQALLGDAVELIGQTGRLGGRYISDRASFTIAGHAALDAYAPHHGAVDGVLLACFGDPGLMALKEIAGVPALGLAEASFAAASAGGRRFAVVTGGVRWPAMLEQLAGELGYAGSLAGIEAVTLTGGQIAENPDGAVSMLIDACRAVAARTGADAVILGGAGLVGLAARVAPSLQVPVLCSVEAGFRAAAEALRALATNVDTSPAGVLPVDTVGLSGELAALFTRGAG
jgi:Asp/Glu/hydantoin racemase